jgi:hypothetical protein
MEHLDNIRYMLDKVNKNKKIDESSKKI